MNQNTAARHRDRPLNTDADLQEALDDLLQDATHRQFWMFMLDERNRIISPIMPMDDHPLDPHEVVDVEDLGQVTVAQLMIDRARLVGEVVGAASYVFVWERVGGERFQRDEKVWAGAFARALSDVGLELRAQFVLSDCGVRQITADDYA